MDRRAFITACGAAAAMARSGASSETAPAVARRPGKLRMHLGTQQGPTTAEMLDYFKRCGVEAVCGWPKIDKDLGYWTREELERTRDLCVEHGIALEIVGLAFPSTSHVDHVRHAGIILGQDPERQREMECVEKMVAACAAAGVPAVKYNLTYLGVPRTPSTPGRGGARYSTWRLAEAKELPLTRAGRITADIFWQRITWFLDRFIPICNHHKIRAACHPHDPPVPVSGYQGIDRVLGTPEGLKRLVSIQESPYHGLNFCVGTVAEMLADPGREIHDVIRWFGSRKKIFNIHFRNIRGRRDDFQEVYPDEGSLDMVAVARDLRDVDYPYMVMPDHVPGHPDDPRGLQGFAYAMGYIKGVLQAIGSGE